MTDPSWWRRGVLYQVYPRSFADASGDGVGDLAGLEGKLDYLAELGVAAVWLSPIYPSPMADFGYDVADYCDVDPLFGSLADFDRLVAAAHARGLRVILDYVPNHTSDRHPWFVASRSSRTDPKRDWYIWRDGSPGGGPPNNWISHFGGSAWEHDAMSGRYYLHSFLKEQPDLNWRNPEVEAAMLDVLRFWLERGVDGFRVDVLWLLIKDDRFRDNPPNPAYRGGPNPRDALLSVYDADRPEVQRIVRAMRAVLDSYGDRLLIGEIYLPLERLVAYYGTNLDGAQMPFNFQLISTAWNASALAALIRAYDAALPAGAWPNWVLGNHDNARIATRVGPERARLAALLLLTLRGTPTMYYGDELGMEDVPIPPDRVRDPAEKRQPGLGFGRDPERTPMRWNPSPGAGFTSGEAWLPIGDARVCNVASEDADPASMLRFYRDLLRLRRERPALALGSLEALAAEGELLRYERVEDTERLLILLNFGDAPARTTVARGRVVLATTPTLEGASGGAFELAPHAGCIVALEPGRETS